MAKSSSSPGSNQIASSIAERTTPAAEYHKETEQETQAAVARIKQHISNSKARIAAQKTKTIRLLLLLAHWAEKLSPVTNKDAKKANVKRRESIKPKPSATLRRSRRGRTMSRIVHSEQFPIAGCFVAAARQHPFSER